MSIVTRRNFIGCAGASIAFGDRLKASAPCAANTSKAITQSPNSDSKTSNFLSLYGMVFEKPRRSKAYEIFSLPAAQTVEHRIEISDFSQDEIRVKGLKAAYENLRAQKSSYDPSLFSIPATLHMQACDSSGSQTNAHNMSIFFAWHRAFIYFHEWQLRRYPGLAGFRMPYWDPHKFDVFPCLYNDKPLDNFREFKVVPAMDWTYGLQFLATAKSTQELAKGLYDWHTAIHSWVGGNMHYFAQAAFDPIFYLWHANVDRAWATSGLETTAMPEVWAPFWKFFPGDKAAVWVYVRLNDFCKKTEDLGYSYDKLMEKPVERRPYCLFENLPVTASTYDLLIQIGNQDPRRVSTIQTLIDPGSNHGHYPATVYWPGEDEITAIKAGQAHFFIEPALLIHADVARIPVTWSVFNEQPQSR